MSSPPSTIRVAILGGGLAGIALLRGLLRYPHIAADIYESRPAFKEAGLGLVLIQNTDNLLRAVDPSLDRCLDHAGAVDSITEIRLATGPDAGKKIEDTKGLWGSTQRTVSQQALMDELLKGLPPRMVHTNTRPASITELPYGEGVDIAFADGSQKKYDVVIGADGIHGITRKHVLGAEDPALEPEHTHVWGLPIKVPLLKAKEAMGANYIDPKNPTQLIWIGDGNMMRHNFQDNGKEVHISTYIRRDDDPAQDNTWARLFTPGEFRAAFAKNELQVCQGMVELIQNVYTIQLTGISQMQHPPAHTYVTQKTALIGDAAHAIHLFPGAGAVLGLEEALVLSSLLGRTPSREAIPAALMAFDRVCRPRAEQGLRDSEACALLLTGKSPGIGLDAELIAQQLQGKWDFLLDASVEGLKGAAASVMDQILEGVWRP
ncbi:hypothetical protein F4810DRAFT_132260 [Camillea tinctor]|nr:hypothetical protein F4810DRAFT_132260 [Camillea tinctor]